MMARRDARREALDQVIDAADCLESAVGWLRVSGFKRDLRVAQAVDAARRDLQMACSAWFPEVVTDTP